MKKKLAAAVSGGAVLMLLLSGCSDDGDTKSADWAKNVCDKWQPEYKKIEAANAELKRVATESSKPEEVQKTDSAAFQTMSEAFTAISAALRDAGEPPGGDGGKTAVAAATQGFNDTAKGYADLKAKMDALDPKDQAKFAQGLQDLSSGLEKVAADEKAAKEKLKAGGLDKPMAGQEGCKVTTPAPTQS
ncbi:small secreted protein [Streptomyces sp. NPDC051211]|uniref:small secreted protein n=1 Tax=Streptomyces sp. NPDC051211 TaxID=3154643 RepID=UPI00344F3E81